MKWYRSKSLHFTLLPRHLRSWPSNLFSDGFTMRHELLIGYDCTASSVRTITKHFRSRYLLRRLLILRNIEGTWGIRPFSNSDTSLSFWNKCSGVYYWVSVLWSRTAKRDSHSCSVKQYNISICTWCHLQLFPSLLVNSRLRLICGTQNDGSKSHP